MIVVYGSRVCVEVVMGVVDLYVFCKLKIIIIVVV